MIRSAPWLGPSGRPHVRIVSVEGSCRHRDPPAMTTIKITLSESLKSFVDNQVSQSG
jgi:hypothetical protein